MKRNKPFNSSNKVNLFDIGSLLIVNGEINSAYRIVNSKIKKEQPIYCRVVEFTESFTNTIGELQNNHIEYIKVTMHANDWSNDYNYFKIDDEYFRYESGSVSTFGYLDIIFSKRKD